MSAGRWMSTSTRSGHGRWRAAIRTGRREILSIDVGEAETEAFWTAFLRGLVKRGLVGVQLAISDAHAGLTAAIAKVLGCAWQLCTVHFLRTVSVTPANQHGLLGALIRSIFAADSLPQARDRLSEAVAHRTGASCARRTPSSASTKKSADAPTWSASSPTTAARSASPGCSASNKR